VSLHDLGGDVVDEGFLRQLSRVSEGQSTRCVQELADKSNVNSQELLHSCDSPCPDQPRQNILALLLQHRLVHLYDSSYWMYEMLGRVVDATGW